MILQGRESLGECFAPAQAFPIFNSKRFSGALCVLALLALLAVPARADTNQVSPASDSSSCPVLNYFDNWFARVDATRAEQPRFFPPIFTTSPGLQEVVRYDFSQELLAGGRTLTSYGFGKGVEFIPSEHIQFIVGLPAYLTENTTPQKDGWADETFLMKYRFAAGNETNGNYVVTGFLGLSVPNGSDKFTTHHFILTPTAAFAKGWGDFNVQNTLGVSVPDNDQGRNSLGTPVALNTTAQYRIAKIFWPEVEANYTWYPNGTHEGLNQLFLTPGLGFGRIPIAGRVGFMIGVGCQIAVTDHPLYHNNLILTTRIPF